MLLFAFLGKGRGSNDMVVGIVGCPCGKKDVVFHVWGDEVGGWWIGGDGEEFAGYGGCEGYGGEDC